MSLARQTVWPRECAFLLTFPTTREEFFEDTHPGQATDFLQKNFARTNLTQEENWKLYRPTADLAEEVTIALQNWGVHVIRRARATDCFSAMAANRVTILCAHWRSSEIDQEDVNWQVLEEILENCETMVFTDWAARLIEAGSAALDCPQQKTVFIDKLNRLIRDECLVSDPRFGGMPGQRAATKQHQMFLNRKALDKCFPGVFRNGTSVEFADGFILIESFANCVNANYAGILDLSVCNSILLGEMIKLRAKKCLVVATELPALVEFRLLLYRSLFQLLRDGQPYLETLTRLREELLRSIKREDS
jgi:hypothetical protein